MAFHCAWAVRGGWLTAACCAWLLTGGMGRPVFAQAPADPPFAVEQWSGQRKLTPDLGTPATGEAKVLDLTPRPTSRVTQIPQPATPVADAPNQNQLLGDWSEEVFRSTTRLAQECGSAVQTCAGTMSNSSTKLVETLGGGVRSRTDTNVRVEVALQPTSHVEAPREIAPVVADVARPIDESMPWYKVVWLQIAVAGGAVVAGPLIVALALGIMLRRSGLQLRVEVTNPGMLRYEAGAPVAQMPTQETVGDDPHTGERFDLGPSYEEERQAKQAAALQAEKAVLQEIYEQNVRLHEEIRAVDSPTLTPDETATPAQVIETLVSAADPLAAALQQYAAMWPDEKLEQ